jgi:signal transduction histidine kinase
MKTSAQTGRLAISDNRDRPHDLEALSSLQELQAGLNGDIRLPEQARLVGEYLNARFKPIRVVITTLYPIGRNDIVLFDSSSAPASPGQETLDSLRRTIEQSEGYIAKPSAEVLADIFGSETSSDSSLVIGIRPRGRAIGVIAMQMPRDPTPDIEEILFASQFLSPPLHIACLQADLRRAQTELIEQERLASLGSLTAGIAHEIKNPLNFINNFSQLMGDLASELREELAEHPEALGTIEEVLSDLETNASRIEGHGRRADSIVRSMLMHARHGTGNRETVDLKTLIDEYTALAYHGRRAQQPDFNVELEQDLDDGPLKVQAIPQDMGRVILNLVTNAFDAVDERRLASDGDTYSPRVRIEAKATDAGVRILVEDNGSGMSEEVAERIFEPFFTTKPSGHGTGLGLPMSRDIITEGHGGSLEVHSEANVGTTFRIFLPNS